MFRLVCFLLLISSSSLSLCAENHSPIKAQSMDNSRLETLLKKIDPNLEGSAGFWSIQLADFKIQIITDQNADRMRIVSPIVKADNLEKEQLYRLMQANFESALDSRYAIANEVVWSTFIHPLSALTEKELGSAIIQVISLVATYGSSYSSTDYNFGGGDNNEPSQNNNKKETI